MIEYVLPTASQLHNYLKLKHWDETAPGAVGSLWVNGRTRIGVPHDDQADLLEGAVERVARYERRKPRDVALDARYLLYDVTHVRAVTDSRLADTIPLETAERIIASTRKMLRAAATTARSERAHIRSYSPLGDEVVKQALMGHTERGSFVIPVLIPLPEPSPLEASGQAELQSSVLEDLFGAMVNTVRNRPEPFERRVVRTFAQSMQAVRDLVAEPAVAPSSDQIYELVYRGVSREFCQALSSVLGERVVAQFGATVDWAPALPVSMPTDVQIDAGAADLIKSVAGRMRRQKADPNQIFSGTIVQLRHESQDDPYGEISVSTLRHGRQSEVVVRLEFSQYVDAWQWHSEGRAVLIEGVVESTPGHRLRVNNPRRCLPLDETFLF